MFDNLNFHFMKTAIVLISKLIRYQVKAKRGVVCPKIDKTLRFLEYIFQFLQDFKTLSKMNSNYV